MREITGSRYRPDIDGLRAVAVVGVITYHAAPSWLPGGYVGVDVFFVISGFLISGIILRERDMGQFSLMDFYARRIRRLFPALAIVLTATLLLGWYYLLPDEFVALGKHMMAGAGYAINFVLRWETGYFDTAAEAKPLLHLWSLGVEEQFYIVWPLLLLLVRERRALLLVIAAVIAASFIGSLYSLTNNQAAAFYLPHHRMWQLAAGALLGAIALYQPRWLRIRLQLANAVSIFGFLLIVGAMLLLARKVYYPGFYGLLPVSGAALLIAAGPQALVNRQLLANPAAVFVGLISYPLYLWHWPLLSFAHILGVKSNPWVLVAILVASPVLAALTYYVVERPVKHLRGRKLAPALVACTTTIGLIGGTAYLTWLSPRLNAQLYQELSSATSDWENLDGLRRDRSITTMKLFRSGRTGPNTVLYLGDSNVEQYWPRVRQLGADRPIVFATQGGCPPIPGMRLQDRLDCDWFTSDIARVASDPNVTTVVISAAWLSYFDSASYIIAGVGPVVRDTPGWNVAFERLGQLIREFRNNGKIIWLVLGIPRGGTLGPQSAVRRSLSGEVVLKPMYADRQASWQTIHTELRRVAENAGARIIDPIPFLCAEQVCPGRSVSGAIMYMDGGHLRASYVREHAVFIDQTLQDISTGSITYGPSSGAR